MVAAGDGTGTATACALDLDGDHRCSSEGESDTVAAEIIRWFRGERAGRGGEAGGGRGGEAGGGLRQRRGGGGGGVKACAGRRREMSGFFFAVEREGAPGCYEPAKGSAGPPGGAVMSERVKPSGRAKECSSFRSPGDNFVSHVLVVGKD
jgi:hypothetical protein